MTVTSLKGEPGENRKPAIGVVIPSYKVRRHILNVISRIGPECTRIYVVDDCCPENTGDYVAEHCKDPRTVVLRNHENLGVGGAVMVGYRAALSDEMEIIVKIDGDGQMAPELLPNFVAPIVAGYADYTKGNRFFDLTQISKMPAVRLMGNAALSFMTKLSAGYWDIFDPTNGYTAIHADVARHLPLEKISKRYFFETDVLFRLNTIRAVVLDIPMDAFYGEETSNLRISNIFPEFLFKHSRNIVKRIFYNYFLRDLSIASLELVAGLIMVGFGVAFSLTHWIRSAAEGVSTPVGTIMLAVMPILLGAQFLLAFLGHDISATPRTSMYPRLARRTQFAVAKATGGTPNGAGTS